MGRRRLVESRISVGKGVVSLVLNRQNNFLRKVPGASELPIYRVSSSRNHSASMTYPPSTIQTTISATWPCPIHPSSDSSKRATTIWPLQLTMNSVHSCSSTSQKYRQLCVSGFVSKILHHQNWKKPKFIIAFNSKYLNFEIKNL